MFAVFAFVFSASAQDEMFQQARAAYDDGRYTEAAAAYEKIIDEGVANAEVHYNLANAYFKDSDLANAILHYRVAGHEAPRDPDIKANLRFALNAAGAAVPTPSFLERGFSTLSRAEWILVAVAGYTVLSLLLILLLLAKPIRRILLRGCLVPLAAIAVAAAGWTHWKQLEMNPEWVVVQTEATALFGPVDGSTAHFKLPLGALARQVDTDPKGWIELTYDGRNGWVKAAYIKPVSP